MENNHKRHISVTIWSYFCIVINVLSLLLTLLRIPLEGWNTALPIALSLVNIYAIALILDWQRVGFYLILVSSVLAFVHNLSIMGFSSYLLTGLLGPVFWILILQAKSDDGVKCWSKLE